MKAPVLALLCLFPAAFAQAKTYVSDRQAMEQLWPGVALKSLPVSGLGASKALALYRGKGGEWLAIDEVIGKHRPIRFALAVEPSGRIKGLEILVYQEAYGHQVRQASWRRQFTGRSLKDPLALRQDIDAISGATLSCDHVTAGVRRILKLIELVHAEK